MFKCMVSGVRCKRFQPSWFLVQHAWLSWSWCYLPSTPQHCVPNDRGLLSSGSTEEGRSFIKFHEMENSLSYYYIRNRWMFAFQLKRRSVLIILIFGQISLDQKTVYYSRTTFCMERFLYVALRNFCRGWAQKVCAEHVDTCFVEYYWPRSRV